MISDKIGIKTTYYDHSDDLYALITGVNLDTPKEIYFHNNGKKEGIYKLFFEHGGLKKECNYIDNTSNN